MRIIAIANQKGGCGKTTTAINLSACLSEAGKNVLLVDLDPQGHATLGLNIKSEELDKSMYNVLTPIPEKKAGLDDVIIPVSHHLDLAPANILLSAIEQELSGKPGRETILREAISAMAAHKTFDYIIIDCSPSLGLLTFNALCACAELIAPVEVGFFSLHGISRLMETVNLVDRQLNHTIRVRALVTMFDSRTKFAHEVKDQIYTFFPESVYAAAIHNTVRLQEASSHGVPVIHYDAGCRGAHDYMALSEEVIKQEFRHHDQKKDVRRVPVRQPLMKQAQFIYHDPSAKSIEIAGDFNNWVVTQLDRSENRNGSLWKTVVNLEPGLYRYKFIVDGKWVVDPMNPKSEMDNLGNMNSLLELKENLETQDE